MTTWIVYDRLNGYESIGESFPTLFAAMDRVVELNKQANSGRYGYDKQK
jgi:hypothetical protein